MWRARTETVHSPGGSFQLIPHHLQLGTPVTWEPIRKRFIHFTLLQISGVMRREKLRFIPRFPRRYACYFLRSRSDGTHLEHVRRSGVQDLHELCQLYVDPVPAHRPAFYKKTSTIWEYHDMTAGAHLSETSSSSQLLRASSHSSRTRAKIPSPLNAP